MKKKDYSAVPSIAPDNVIIVSSYSNKYMYLEERRSPLHTCDNSVKAEKIYSALSSIILLMIEIDKIVKSGKGKGHRWLQARAKCS